MNIERRRFTKNIGIASVAPCFINTNLFDQIEEPLSIHIFSKHLHFLDLKAASEVAAELGFDGIDLTVRKKGHVRPEDVNTHLPIALQDIRQNGSSCQMITTAISDISNPVDKDIIRLAGQLGIKYYRSNWFSYKEDLSIEESIDYYKEKVRQLGVLNKKSNIIGCYQNHSGLKIGASIWEVKKILESTNPLHFGAQYDIRHAVAEGGRSWPNGVRLLKEYIKTIVLKDFIWGKVNGKWKIVNVPIGEGMVDFRSYFKLLKKLELNPPVSLHLEYPLGGAEKGRNHISIDKSVVFKAMKKDLDVAQQIWKES